MATDTLLKSRTKNTREKLIIIGSGPAGLTAALYAARAKLEPLVLEGKQPGGQLMGTTYIENWPGEERILGPELMSSLRKHAQSFGARSITTAITQVDFSQPPFKLITEKGDTLESDALIIAMGATPRRIGCPGEDFYWGKGVSTCAICDGAFYKDKKVIIVGGGDTALEDASFMTHFTPNITIVHILDAFTASQPMQERIRKYPSIRTIYTTAVKSIEGDGKHITHVTLINQRTGDEQTLEADALFVAIGLRPNTGLFKGQLELDSQGYIIQKKYTETSVPGIFAAGDIIDPRYKQAITSSGSGCMAALDAEKYLKHGKL